MFRSATRSATAAAVLSLSVAALADPVPAGDATAVVATPGATEAKDKAFPLHASASLTQQLGSATFVSTGAPETYNPTFSSALTLAPSATLARDWTLSLQQVIGIEWTRSDSTTYTNQLELSDLGVRISYSGLSWEDLNLSLGLNAGYQLPISMQSRHIGSTGALSAGTRLGWALQDLGLTTSISFGVGVNPTLEALAARFANVPVLPYNDRTLGPTTPVSCNKRPGEGNGACLDGAWPSGVSWRTGVGVGYTPPILDNKLSLSADVGYAQGFSSYIAPTEGTTQAGLDTFDNADLKADNARDFTPRQSTQGNLSASYQAADFFVATIGAQSGQPFLNQRGDGIRFPFWDFTSTANNFSSIYVDTSFSF